MHPTAGQFRNTLPPKWCLVLAVLLKAGLTAKHLQMYNGFVTALCRCGGYLHEQTA
jgi:hypothetical protein